MNTYMKAVFVLVATFTLMFAPFSGAAASVYYVSPGGNNSNDCLSPTSPCATISSALGKAAAGDVVKVAIGTFIGTGVQVVLMDKDITLSGGWNSAFTAQSGTSTIDGESARLGVWVNADVSGTIDHFTIQNGHNSSGASGIFNEGDLIVLDSVVQNNSADSSCWGAGVLNFGTLTVERTTIRNNRCNDLGYGGGITSWYGGPVVVIDSTISGNQSDSGAGIFSRTSLYVVNSTISHNIGGFNTGGGGIRVEGGSLILINSTVAFNEGGARGGGLSADGEITLSNSIVANNIANTSPDCSGLVNSAGYNLIGDTIGCSFSSTTGDQLNVDPKLGDLQDNGGPTFTHWLYAGSPAIDGGNPAGCLDHLGSPLATDQRGFTRPMDGDSDGSNVCDVGAYEVDPNHVPPPSPDSLWYVTPIGNDTNDCHTPTTACQTLNGAINKAQSGDTVYVSTGVYSAAAGDEVVFIDRNINLAGGWDAAFTSQTGLTTIDGQHAHRGVTLIEQITATIENFNIQNGRSPYADITGYGGGGIYIDFRADLTLTASIVQANTAGSDGPVNTLVLNGGGIGMNNYGRLILNDCFIIGNLTYGAGGGIYSAGSAVTLNDSIVGYNVAKKGGGIAGGNGGSIELNQSSVIYNTSTDPTEGGGGINSVSNTLVLEGSSVTGNIAAGEGGGIVGDAMTIENSVVSENEAANGGGIRNWYNVELRNSAVLNNTATSGDGGGIYSGGDLVIINSTIANNKAENPTGDEADGGGIFRAGGFIQASNATIARNWAEDSGGGIANQSAPVNLRNTLLADNWAPLGPDCLGTISTDNYNLIGDTSGCNYVPGTGDLTNIDPELSLLYGWPATPALQVDSPAIDGGNPGGCMDHQDNPLIVDQVGTDRPLDGDSDNIAICDIGAFEYDPAHPPQWRFLPLLRR